MILKASQDFDFTGLGGNNVVGSSSTCAESDTWDELYHRCKRHGDVFDFNKCVSLDNDLNATVNSESTSISPLSITTVFPNGSNKIHQCKKYYSPKMSLFCTRIGQCMLTRVTTRTRMVS